MRMQLAKRVQKRLPTKKYVPVKTTFVTEDGPAIGTIWFDAELPSREPLIVQSVDGKWVLGHFVGRVNYTDGDWQPTRVFLEHVRSGRFMLIGVTPAVTSHTVT